MSAPALESLAIDTRLGDLQPEFWSAAGFVSVRLGVVTNSASCQQCPCRQRRTA